MISLRLSHLTQRTMATAHVWSTMHGLRCTDTDALKGAHKYDRKFSHLCPFDSFFFTLPFPLEYQQGCGPMGVGPRPSLDTPLTRGHLPFVRGIGTGTGTGICSCIVYLPRVLVLVLALYFQETRRKIRRRRNINSGNTMAREWQNSGDTVVLEPFVP